MRLDLGEPCHFTSAPRDHVGPPVPLAQRASGRFALLVAREGADYFAWRAGWFRQLEAEIISELDARQC